MKYIFSDLIDINLVEKLISSFYQTNHISLILVDPDGNIIASAGWNPMSNFSNERKQFSGSKYSKNHHSTQQNILTTPAPLLVQCDNELVQILAPLVINTMHLATLYSPRFFNKTPNPDSLNKQAFNKLYEEEKELNDYIASIDIKTDEEINKIIDHFTRLTTLFNTIGQNSLKNKQSEQALWLKTEKLQWMITNAGDIFMAVDKTSTITYVNDTSKQIIGYTSQEITQQSLLNLVHPEDLNDVKLFFKKLTTHNKKKDTISFRHQHKTKGWIDVLMIATNHLNTPSIESILINIRDITSQLNTSNQIIQFHKLIALIRNLDKVIYTALDTDKLLSEICRILAQHEAFSWVWIGKKTQNTNLTPHNAAGIETDFLIEVLKENSSLNEYFCSIINQTTSNQWIHTASKNIILLLNKVKHDKNSSIISLPIRTSNPQQSTTLFIHSSTIPNKESVLLLKKVSETISLAIEKIATEKLRNEAEKRVRFSEKNLQQAQAMIKMGSWEYNLQDNTFWWSPELFNILNLKPSSPPSLTQLSKLIHPDDIHQVTKTILQSSKSISKFQIDFRIKLTDSLTKKIRTKGEFKTPQSGRPIKAKGLVIDISEQDRLEKDLIASTLRFKKLFELNGDGIILTDPKTHIIYSPNNSFCTLTGYDLKEITSLTINKLHPNKDFLWILKSIENQNIQNQHKNVPVIKKDKTTIYTDLITVPIELDQKSYIMEIFHDITERHQREQSLLKAEEQLSNIINYLPDPTLVIDKNGIILAWNRAIEKMTGRKAEEMIGKGNYEYALPFYKNRRPMLINLALTPHINLSKKYSILKQEGDDIYAETQIDNMPSGTMYLWGKAAPLRNKKSEIIGAIESIRDITHRKKIEQENIQTRQQLENTINYLPDPTLVINKQGIVTFWNLAMEELTGVSSKAMVGKGNYEYAIPFYGKRRPLLLNDTFESNNNLHKLYSNFKQEGDVLFAEVTITRWKKGHINLWLKASPLYDTQGNISGAIETIRDITALKKIENKIRTSETRLRMLTHATPAYIFEIDKTGLISFVNRTYAGLDESDVIGTNILDWYPELQRKRIKDWIKITFKYQKTQKLEYTIPDLQGNEISYLAELVPTKDASHNDKAVLTATDISYRKNTELQLQKVTDRLKAIIKSIPDFIFLLDHEGRFIDAFAPEDEKFFIKPEDFLQKTVSEVLPKEIAENAKKAIEEIFKSKKKQTFTYTVNSETYESRFSPCGENEIVILDRNITEQKRIEESIRQLAQRLENIHNIDKSIIQAKSPQEVASQIMKIFENMFPLDSLCILTPHPSNNKHFILIKKANQQIKQHSCTIANMEHDLINLPDEIALYAPGIWPNLPKTIRLNLHDSDTFFLLSSPFYIHNYPQGVLFCSSEHPFNAEKSEIMREMSEEMVICIKNSNMRNEIANHAALLEEKIKERTRELEDSNKELEAFSYSISHDLRTPLRAIQGYGQILKEDYEQIIDKTGQQYLQRISSSSIRMAEMIDGLLSLSRITRGRTSFTLLKISRIVSGIIQELSETTPHRKIELKIQENIHTYGDSILIQAMLQNLLSNAWKFTEQTPSPIIEFGTIKQNKQTIFFIRDNGAGFDMRYVNKLFGAFQRLHTGDEFEGTGIGLAIVKRIIERHNGKIWAEAEINKGATFFFTLNALPKNSLT